MADKRVVGAVSVTADRVICPCGEVIDLKPDPDPPPVLKGRKMVYPTAIGGYRLPQVWRRSAIGSVLERFHISGELIRADTVGGAFTF